jgi:glucose-1-phosphate adenylyltransferase
VANGKAVAHRFGTSCVKADREVEAYWRDVGTIDAYWEANIDLTSVVPSLDLYDNDWPIWSYSEITAPAKFVHNDTHRRGAAINSLVAGGCIVSGSHVEKSLLFTGVKVHSFAHLDGAVVQPYAEIGRGARLRNVVIDRGVVIPAGLVVGEDPEKDARRFRRTEKGRVLITQPMIDKLPE